MANHLQNKGIFFIFHFGHVSTCPSKKFKKSAISLQRLPWIWSQSGVQGIAALNPK